MNSPAESPSPLVRFFDGFLQERNIKWILAAGVAILLGSSVMMVQSHWESIGDVWRYMILLGYVGVIHGAGQWCYHRFVLHKTGSVLMALTVLLLPLSFVAWHQFAYLPCLDRLGQLHGTALALGMLLPNLLLAAAAARRIFTHFLKRTQPTFLVSYLVLCVAGAVAPVVASLGTVAMVVASLAMWAVFLVGSVKVNRHVFWLTEEHNAPRVCGFLPVLLLGIQFLGVFAANFAGAIPTAWLGLGLVLVAMPVLLTADAVADVFQQRTGNLVRPLPWPVAMPLFLGTLLCVAGVGLAGIQNQALVPAAALGAVVMALVARRTNQKFFVWLALAGVVLAYNLSHVFFTDVASQVVGAASSMVREVRLPYAFYGLTNLPLLFALTAGAAVCSRRNNQLFAAPLRQLSVALAGLLLVVSFAHSALYPTFMVGLVMTGVFALQAWLYSDRRLAFAAVVSWLVAATGSASFAEHFFSVSMPGAELLGPALGAVVLMVIGVWLDPRIVRLPWGARQTDAERQDDALWLPQATCQLGSAAATLAVAGMWVARYSVPDAVNHAWVVAAVVGVMLVVHCLRWLHTVLTAVTYGFGVAVAVCATVALQLPWQVAVSLATCVLLAQWLLDYAFTHRPRMRVAKAFAIVNRFTSYGGLAALLALVYLPLLTAETFVLRFDSGLHRIVFAFVTVWAFDAARRSRRAAFAVAGSLAVLVLASVAWLEVAELLKLTAMDAYQWLPCLWAAVALAALPVVSWLRQREQSVVGFATHVQQQRLRAISEPVSQVSRFVLQGVAIFTLLGLAWPLRMAGAVAVAGLFALAQHPKNVALRTHALVLANWHALAMVVALTALSTSAGWLGVLASGGATVMLPLAFAAAASAVVWQCLVTRVMRCDADYVHLHSVMCQVLAGMLLVGSLALPYLTPLQFIFAGATFVLMVMNECRVALSEGSEARAWLAEVLAGLAVAYFAWFHVISFGRGRSMFVVLGLGLVAHVLVQWVTGRAKWNVFRRPLLALSMGMPLVAVVIATARHFIYAAPSTDPAWFGMNSLAMLLAAGFYFWQAMEADEHAAQKRSGLLVLSAAIVNAALALLWVDLEWTDPQLFLVPIGMSALLLVEMLRKEIPVALHNPLRYAGALVVLVSPTFDIVGGSWVHLFSLMVLSVVVMLLGIGVRVRVLVYAGSAFLCADLVAMVVRGSIDNPNLLWVAGIACGAAVLALGAFCENNREVLLQRMRAMSAKLETWN